MDIGKNIIELRSSIPEEVQLVAVSKTKPAELILKAYEAGHRDFGENRVQELVSKWERLPRDIHWHLIGHLQRNKVKYIAEFVDLIHAVDNFKLLQEINKQALKHERVIDCLLQIKIAEEESKFGMTADEAEAILTSEEIKELKNIRICGLMGMATFTDDQDQLKSEFDYLRNTFDNLKSLKTDHISLNILSMGMSGDYELAIKCGSNMVRVGSKIFGERY